MPPPVPVLLRAQLQQHLQRVIILRHPHRVASIRQNSHAMLSVSVPIASASSLLRPAQYHLRIGRAEGIGIAHSIRPTLLGSGCPQRPCSHGTMSPRAHPWPECIVALPRHLPGDPLPWVALTSNLPDHPPGTSRLCSSVARHNPRPPLAPNKDSHGPSLSTIRSGMHSSRPRRRRQRLAANKLLSITSV